jgi:hypothetical protein
MMNGLIINAAPWIFIIFIFLQIKQVLSIGENVQGSFNLLRTLFNYLGQSEAESEQRELSLCKIGYQIR